jgi:hypothetical protein
VQPPIRKSQGQVMRAITPRCQGQTDHLYDYSCGIDLSCRRSGELYAGEVQTVVMQKVFHVHPCVLYRTHRDYAMDLSKYDMVYFFGDSMIQQLARRFQTNLYWNDRIFIKKM